MRTPPTPPVTARAPVWRAPGMPALMAFTLLGFAGYSLLLPVVPMWAVRGGAGPAGAGLVNGVMLGVTVAAQLFVPAALRRLGWGPVMAGGVVLLGVPSLAHLVSDALGWVLLLAGIRGVGFAVLTVTGAAAAAHLVDPSRRGAAIGAYGLAVAVPGLGLLPFGPLLTEIGWPLVFAIGALPVLAVPACLLLAPHLPGEATPAPTASSSLPYRALTAPAALLLAVTLAGGAVMTFAPQLVAHPSAATAALFSMGLFAAASRWVVGGLADRYGPGRFVWPTTLLAVLCLLALAFTLGVPEATPVAGPTGVATVIAVTAALGVSYGALQNLTYVLTLRRVEARDISAASAVWNAGFDAGTALGSTLVGVIAAGAGFGWAFLAAALACATTLPLAVRARRS